MPLLVALGVTVLAMYCLMDVVTSNRDEVRVITKFGWAVVVVVVPILGPVAWLTLGRPPKQTVSSDHPAAGSGATPPRGPDDDPDFLREIEDRLRRRDR